MSHTVSEEQSPPAHKVDGTSATKDNRKRKAQVWIANGIFVVYIHVVAILTVIFLRPSIRVFALTLFTSFTALFGITMGYHRLWSHRAYRAMAPLRLLLALLGTMSVQGSIKWWCERHRLHHRFTDTDHDPYNARRGFWYSHIGWIFERPYYSKLPSIDISDLLQDPSKERPLSGRCCVNLTLLPLISLYSIVVRMQHRYYVPLALLLGFVLPSIVAWWWWDEALGGLLYAGHVAKLCTWHATFCINSFAHWIGAQDYSLQFTARGNLLLAIFTHGEGHHNFHHEFPRDYRNGIRWYDYDPTKWLIKLCECLGLATGLVATPGQDVKKALIQTAEQKLAIIRKEMCWGPELSKLPRISKREVERRAREGDLLVIVDGLVYDVSAYAAEHPGGMKLLKAYSGRDASLAFNGGLNNHTQAARTLARSLAVAVLAE